MKFTKEEVIGVAFSKLRPKRGDVFADVGCGSGAVAEFFSPYVKKVYAVDVDEEAFKSSKERLANFDNVEVLKMHGKDFLESFEYDIAFIGGTKDLEDMLKVCSARRFVISAARMEVVLLAKKVLEELGKFEEVVIVNVSRSYDLAGGTAFRNINPVFLVVGCSTE